MPGTGTFPNAELDPTTSALTTLHLVDASGDLYTESILSTAPVTGTQLNSLAVAYQAATNASLYKVSSTSVWEGDLDPDNAVAAFRASSKDGINLLFKNLTTLDTYSGRVIAPIDTIMQGNQDIPLITAMALSDLILEYLAILAGYNLQSAQFTERRERSNNPRIRI